MRSAKKFEFSIKIRVEKVISRIFRTDYNAIFSYRILVSTEVPFRKFENVTKIFAKQVNKIARNHCTKWFQKLQNTGYTVQIGRILATINNFGQKCRVQKHSQKCSSLLRSRDKRLFMFWSYFLMAVFLMAVFFDGRIFDSSICNGRVLDSHM